MANTQTSAAGESGAGKSTNYMNNSINIRILSMFEDVLNQYCPTTEGAIFDAHMHKYYVDGKFESVDLREIETDPNIIALRSADNNVEIIEIAETAGDVDTSSASEQIIGVVRYSCGIDKFDNSPKQLEAQSFDEFRDLVLASRSPQKGKTYFCSALAYGYHNDTSKYPDEGHYRLAKNVEPRRFLPIDFDGFKDVAAFDDVIRYLGRYKGFGYTTWSHTASVPRARAVLELDREVSRDEGVLIGEAFEAQMINALGVDIAKFDESVYRGEQPIYGAPPDATIFKFDGIVLEIDKLLASYSPVVSHSKLKASSQIDMMTANLTGNDFPYNSANAAKIDLGLAKRTNLTGWNERSKWLETMFSMRSLVLDAHWPDAITYGLFDGWAQTVDGGEGLYDEIENRKKWDEPEKGGGSRLTYKSLLEKAISTNEQLPINPITRKFNIYDFVLNGSSTEMEKQMLADKFILGRIALLGNSTAIYAAPNGGKTLLTLSMLIKSVTEGVITARDVFYINADDAHKGMLQKLQLAEKHGFMALAPDYNGFKSQLLPEYLKKLIEQNEARGKIFILDTVKKFTDIMSKEKATEFGKTVRSFVSHGGSVIMLAHVNKHKDSSGKAVYSGTTDIIDDCDAAYTIDTTSVNGVSTAIFTRIKCRGENVNEAAYTFNSADGVQYLDRLASVCEVSSTDSKKVAHATKLIEKYENEITFIEKQLREGDKSQGAILEIHKAHKGTGIGLTTSPKMLIACLKELSNIKWKVRAGIGHEKIYYMI